MPQYVFLDEDKVVLMVTDEQDGEVKVRKVIQGLFAAVCHRRASRHCEGCEKDWPSQRDHECCLKSPEEMLEKYYPPKVNLDPLKNLCRLFCKLPNIPMTPEWDTWVEALPQQSAHAVYTFWGEMRDSWDPLDQAIVEFVDMLCHYMDDEKTWSEATHLRFESYMQGKPT